MFLLNIPGPMGARVLGPDPMPRVVGPVPPPNFWNCGVPAPLPLERIFFTCLIYSRFHKTLPRSSLQMQWMIRFYEIGDTKDKNSPDDMRLCVCPPLFDSSCNRGLQGVLIDPIYNGFIRTSVTCTKVHVTDKRPNRRL